MVFKEEKNTKTEQKNISIKGNWRSRERGVGGSVAEGRAAVPRTFFRPVAALTRENNEEKDLKGEKGEIYGTDIRNTWSSSRTRID